ncbi:MAG: DUF1080 domain-containing protein [Candidatus Sumerlaeota bacterium]|nr:DUF1080 domain-containing protein [Candidatus Sumerlaeota bacterium]
MGFRVLRMAMAIAALLCAALIGCGRENPGQKAPAPARDAGVPKKESAVKANSAVAPTTPTQTAPTSAATTKPQEIAAQEEWKRLFDGRTLGGWKPSDFPGPGKVHVKDGQMIFEVGPDPLTGAAYTYAVPRMDYEISLEAMRMDGSDFFCCLTFPYKESCCSLVVGGWGGDLVGISSFDGKDASENETRRQMDFDNGRWYRIRVRVTENHIEAWIGDDKAVDARPANRKVSVRLEVAATQPLGLAAYRTKAAFRNIQIKKLVAP